MLQAMHEHVEGRLGEEEFQSTADDAVRLAVEAQLRSAVDVITDGEQRRDNYASFVGGLLENCQLIPLTFCPWSMIRRSLRKNCNRWMCRPAKSGTPRFLAN